MNDYRVEYTQYPSYDFLIWLITVELQRQRDRGGRLKVRFGYPPPDHVAVPLFNKVCKPSLVLLDAEETDLPPTAATPDYDMRHVVAAARDQQVPQWRVPQTMLAHVREWLGGRRPIVITLREAEYDRERNSNIAAWIKFADRFGHDEVLFVRDTAKADEPLGGRWTCPLGSRNLLFRAGLYAQARVLFFVSNGPVALAYFLPTAFRILKPVTRNTTPWWIATANRWEAAMGIKLGAQFPWFNECQRIIWADDTYESIVAAWDDLDAWEGK